MKYKNVTTQNYGGTVFKFTTDEGLEGFIIINEIPEDQIKAHHHLIDLFDAKTIIHYPEGKYVQHSRLSKALLTYQEQDAIQILIENNLSAYQKEILKPTPLP